MSEIRSTMSQEPALSASPSPRSMAEEVKGFARELGFDLVGISPALSSQHADYVRDWLDAGRAADMHYLHARLDERLDPTVYFPGAKSIISVAINYRPKSEPIADASTGRIARYAWGDDYHEVIKPRLFQIADRIRQLAPDAQTRVGVDTAPILEREIAARAGIGWVGKNTLVLNERIGSWILLGEVLTTLELPPDEPATDHCGTCRRCIDACPTGAIVAPYELDARRCISYLTIENRDEQLPQPLREAVGDWLFGCDICQEVCPFNSKAPPLNEPAFESRWDGGVLNANAVAEWSVDEYRTTLRRSAIKRVKLPILQRNARNVSANKAGLAADATSPGNAL